MVLLSDEDSSDRIEPESHKDKPKEINDDDDEKNDDDDDDDDDHDVHLLIRTQVTGSLEIRTEKMHTPIPSPSRSPRTDLSSDMAIAQELTDTLEKVNESLKDIVPKLATSATNDIIKDNLPRLVTDAVKKERESSQPVVRFHKNLLLMLLKLLKNFLGFTCRIRVVDVLKAKFEKSSASAGSCRNDAFRKRDHDDHQGDDAPPEGEKSAKRQKTSKSSKSARGSSSKQPVKETNTSASERQQQQQDWDAWVDDPVIDEDEVIPDDETPELIEEFQNVDKRVPTIFDRERMKATLRDNLSNQFRDAKEYAYHLEQSQNYMKNQLVWESRQEDLRRPKLNALVFYSPHRNPNEPPRYLYNKDLFFLKYENTKEKRYVLSLYKIHAILFPEEDFEEKINKWVKSVFKTFNEEARLSIQHWKCTRSGTRK
ncbi:hypothetical protein Tco_1099632 [Tanacetum coccineum]